MSGMASACSIEPNPDIAGIGVRVSIYAQALLSLVHPAIAAWNGELAFEDIKSLRTLYQGSLITACALLFSAFIQAKSTLGLSFYHVLIVLNLSWLSSANAIIFTLYILLWWCVEFFKITEMDLDDSSTDDDRTTSDSRRIMSRRDFLLFKLDPSLKPELARTRNRAKRGIIVVGGLTTIHLIIVGTLGLYVWFNTTTSVFHGQECASELNFVVFGFNVPTTSPTFRRASLAAYFMMLLPVVNLYVFLSLIGVVVGFALFLPIAAVTFSSPLWWEKIPDDPLAWARFMHRSLSGVVLIASMGTQIYFIVNNEQFIARSASLLDSSQGTETDWTFGQTLAIGILAVPVTEVHRAVRDRTKRDRQLRAQKHGFLGNERAGEDIEMQSWLHRTRDLSMRRRRNSI